MGLDMYLFSTKKNNKSFEKVVFNNNWEDFNELVYWRKANHIHKWFVENVQDEIDDCGYYEVSKLQLINLLNDCKAVLNNPTWAKDILPTREGFFFGVTEYNEFYFSSIAHTILEIEYILESFDFENNYLFYSASW